MDTKMETETQQQQAADFFVLGWRENPTRRSVEAVAGDFRAPNVRYFNHASVCGYKQRAGNHASPNSDLRSVQCQVIRRNNPIRVDRLRGTRFNQQFDRVRRCVKKKFQPWADAISTYGIGILDFPGSPAKSYPFLIGLLQNASRVDSRLAYRMLRAFRDGACCMLGNGLSNQYLEALTDSPCEADALSNEIQAAEEMAKIKGGSGEYGENGDGSGGID